jgi:3-hydroxyacyl-[acyl-carrier-protein] dehydratase
MAVIEIDEILKILPHRYPFLLVDRVIECDFEKHIVGIKNVTVNEPYFQGHFPGMPVMPGVLQLEALAQLSGILLNKISNREGSIAFFTTVSDCKFRRMVRPGDTLRMEVEFLRARLKTAKVQGKITVDGERACETQLMFTYTG